MIPCRRGISFLGRCCYTSSFWRRCQSTSALPLRDYQLDCINQCLATIDKGYSKFCVSLPTGSGKTRTFYGLLDAIANLENPPDYSKKWLILAHREELITQAYEQAKRLFPNLTVEVEMGKRTASHNANVIVASVQSLVRRLDRYSDYDIGCIVIDEAHHAPASSYSKILSHLGANDENSKIIVAGFSATLSRMDGLALGSAFDYIAYHKDLTEMIERGYLTKIRFTTVSTGVDLRNVKQAKGDFLPKSLSMKVDQPNLNELVYKVWKAQSGSTSTLIFGVNIAHAGNLAKAFRDNGVDAHVVTSKTPNELRRKIISDFKANKIPILINCGIFTEGTDIPNIDTVILVRPTKSPGLLMQMIGRGLRLSPGKEVCHVIDMFGSSAQANGLATVSTLAGIDPKEVEMIKQNDKTDGFIEDKDEEEQVDEQPSRPFLPYDPKYVLFEEFNNLDEFLNRNNGDILNFASIKSSLLNWICSGKNTYTLFTGDGYLRLGPDKESKDNSTQSGYSLVKFFENPFRNTEINPSKNSYKNNSRYLSKTIFKSLPDFNAALNAADMFARRNCNYQFITRKVPWRDQPHTSRQEERVLKIFDKIIPPNDSQAKDRVNTIISKLSKGECANLINLSSTGNKSVFTEIAYPKQKKLKEKDPKKPVYDLIQPGPVHNIRLENKLS